LITVEDLSLAEREIYEERSAIMEFDGRLPQYLLAERRALEEIERKRRIV
jgi:hypothetical protein